MGKVTDLKAQKRPGRVSVYVDGKFAFGLSDWQVVDYKIRIGKELDESLLAELTSEAEIGKLYDLALRWLAIRPRSHYEINQYLFRKTDDKDLRAKVFIMLNDKGFVNDEKFAQSWLESRRLLKRVSERKLRQEMRSKRIDDAIISKVLAEDDTDELAVLKELVEKKRRMSRYQDDEKLLQYLVRQGFNLGDIKTVLFEQ